jgi:hypothetical protein
MIGAVVSISILLAVATLHAYWASGGNFGKGAAIPERNDRPVSDRAQPSPKAN